MISKPLGCVSLCDDSQHTRVCAKTLALTSLTYHQISFLQPNIV